MLSKESNEAMISEEDEEKFQEDIELNDVNQYGENFIEITTVR